MFFGREEETFRWIFFQTVAGRLLLHVAAEFPCRRAGLALRLLCQVCVTEAIPAKAHQITGSNAAHA